MNLTSADKDNSCFHLLADVLSLFIVRTYQLNKRKCRIEKEYHIWVALLSSLAKKKSQAMKNAGYFNHGIIKSTIYKFYVFIHGWLYIHVAVKYNIILKEKESLIGVCH